MKVTLLAFASAAQQLGWRTREVTAQPGDSPRSLFARETAAFDPGVARVAVNGNYSTWDQPLPADAAEVAILPPVSGG